MHFYTVLIGDRSKTEFQDFTTRMTTTTANNKVQFQELLKWITLIGNEYEARTQYFRKEENAEALPPPRWHYLETEHYDNNYNDYGLRLYCIRLTNNIVILLNGDRKTTQKVNDCENCKPHFRLANKISNAINKAIVNKGIELDIDNYEIEVYDDINI